MKNWHLSLKWTLFDNALVAIFRIMKSVCICTKTNKLNWLKLGLSVYTKSDFYRNHRNILKLRYKLFFKIALHNYLKIFIHEPNMTIHLLKLLNWYSEVIWFKKDKFWISHCFSELYLYCCRWFTFALLTLRFMNNDVSFFYFLEAILKNWLAKY